MRPARKGPENAVVGRRRDVRRECFNEAGPQGAGKRNDITIEIDLPAGLQ